LFFPVLCFSFSFLLAFRIVPESCIAVLFEVGAWILSSHCFRIVFITVSFISKFPKLATLCLALCLVVASASNTAVAVMSVPVSHVVNTTPTDDEWQVHAPTPTVPTKTTTAASPAAPAAATNKKAAVAGDTKTLVHAAASSKGQTSDKCKGQQGSCTKKPLPSATAGAFDHPPQPKRVPAGLASAAAAAAVGSGGSVSGISDPDNLTEEERTILDNFSPVKKFVKALAFLLDSLTKVFPKCIQTKIVKQYFQTTYQNNQKNQEELIRLWDEMMKPYYDDVASNDPARYPKVLNAKIDLFQRLELSSKWKAMSVKSRESLIKQVIQLNKYAHNFCGFHTNFSNKVLGAASDIKGKIERGEVSEDQLTVEDMMQEGMRVAESMTDEDLEQIKDNFPMMMQQIAGSMGKSGKGPSSAGMPSAFDMSSILKAMNSGK
jgi:hypothetical protein